MYGQLLPVGGGDPIPLLKEELLVGRRESCDIVLRFSNVSAHHCQLMCKQGYWYALDKGSRNGTKINGMRITQERLLKPGDSLAIAKHKYKIDYDPADCGATGPPPVQDSFEEILGKSLLDRAGLERQEKKKAPGRYDVANDKGGRFKDPEKPI